MTTTQVWDAGSYERSARFVSDLAGPVVELLAPQPGERILDLGCGDGALTQRIAATGATVVGIDASAAFVAAARARGLDVRHLDGQQLAFDGAFDAVFSNAALHWMPDADAVLRGVHRALVPGGRFVAEFGGHGNVAAIRVALAATLAHAGVDATAVSPWFFPTAGAYRARLERAGFVVDAIALHARPTTLPGDLGDWLDVFAQPFLASLTADKRARVRAETIALVRPILFDGERWIADYVRLRVCARRST